MFCQKSQIGFWVEIAHSGKIVDWVEIAAFLKI